LAQFSEANDIQLSFEAVNESFIQKFADFLITTKNNTNNTVFKKLQFLKTFLKWCKRNGYGEELDLDMIRFSTLKETDVVHPVLTEAELVHPVRGVKEKCKFAGWEVPNTFFNPAKNKLPN